LKKDVGVRSPRDPNCRCGKTQLVIVAVTSMGSLLYFRHCKPPLTLSIPSYEFELLGMHCICT